MGFAWARVRSLVHGRWRGPSFKKAGAPSVVDGLICPWHVLLVGGENMKSLQHV